MLNLELNNVSKRSIYGGQTIVLEYIVTDGKEKYIVDGIVGGLYSGILMFKAERVVENLTWTEDTLTNEAILDKINDYV